MIDFLIFLCVLYIIYEFFLDFLKKMNPFIFFLRSDDLFIKCLKLY